MDRTFEINGKTCDSGKKFNAEILICKNRKYLIFASGSITAIGFLSTAVAREGLEYFFPNNTIDCLRVDNMVTTGKIFNATLVNFQSLKKSSGRQKFFKSHIGISRKRLSLSILQERL